MAAMIWTKKRGGKIYQLVRYQGNKEVENEPKTRGKSRVSKEWRRPKSNS